jgi:hypothetical protein
MMLDFYRGIIETTAGMIVQANPHRKGSILASALSRLDGCVLVFWAMAASEHREPITMLESDTSHEC